MRPEHPGNDDQIDMWAAVAATILVGAAVALSVYLICA